MKPKRPEKKERVVPRKESVQLNSIKTSYNFGWNDCYDAWTQYIKGLDIENAVLQVGVKSIRHTISPQLVKLHCLILLKYPLIAQNTPYFERSHTTWCGVLPFVKSSPINKKLALLNITIISLQITHLDLLIIMPDQFVKCVKQGLGAVGKISMNFIFKMNIADNE